MSERQTGSGNGSGRLGVRLLLAASLMAPVSAQDWPQWRGVNRDGKTVEAGLLQEWPEGGPSLSWRVQGLGEGYSSISILGDRIFTMGDLEEGQYVIALSRDDGRELWKTRVGDRYVDARGGPRSTPTTAGDLLYVVTTQGTVVALEISTGRTIWRRSLTDDFGGYLMRAMGSYEWKFAESPLVDGDKVIVTPGHINALMVALDRRSGEEIWRTQGRRLGPVGADGAAYSSAVISEAAGIRQYIQLVGRGLIGVEAESGRLLWSYNRVASDIANIATPIIEGDYVLGSAGYGIGTALLKLVRSGEEIEAQEVYFLPASTMQNHHGGIILHEGMIYTGTGHNNGFPVALHFLSGEVAWGPVRNSGRESAALTYADQRLYFRYQNGRMILAEANPGSYRERGSFMIPDVEKESWSHPVIAGGRLYLREQDFLLCYDIQAESPE